MRFRTRSAADHYRRSGNVHSLSLPHSHGRPIPVVATVLLIMSLAYSNFITPYAAFALVLEPILGPPSIRCSRALLRGDPASYRLPVGIYSTGSRGIALVAPFLHPLADAFRSFQPDMAKMTAEFHMVFNVVLAFVFIALLDPLAALLVRIFPARTDATDPATPRYLDATALETPSLALADAARETLRMADIVEIMLRQVMTALLSNDRAIVREVSRMGQRRRQARRVHQALHHQAHPRQP